MLKIRLRRVGGKKQPSYRIVVAEDRSPRDGRFVEKIGFYNPRTDPSTIEYEEDRALYWLSVGAQPTDAVAGMFKKFGTMERLARLQKGEDMEALVAEAAASRPVADVEVEEVEVEIEAETEPEPALSVEDSEPEQALDEATQEEEATGEEEEISESSEGT